ncbi:MAG: hypothetical protein IKZ82_11615, partial [Clostridia bacterium]|nr:hypothetical protein [Clostridia bacterium]
VCGTDGLTLISSKALVNPDTFDLKTLLNASAILCVSFVGFDAVTTMAEETKDPQKVMTPAIMGVCVGAVVSAAVGASVGFSSFGAAVGRKTVVSAVGASVWSTSSFVLPFPPQPIKPRAASTASRSANILLWSIFFPPIFISV